MPTIQEVRAKYPQYSDLSDDQLMDGLHRKYYSDMSREDFDKRMGVQKPQTGNLAAAAEGVGQGITFGFGDEIEGAVRGGIDALTSDKSFGEAYDERRDAARARISEAKETNPAAFYTGEIGSAIAVPFTVGPRLAAGAARVLPNAVTNAARTAGFGQTAASAGAGLGARSVAAAREGAAYGAVAGFGHGEGGAVERGENAMLGAGLGAGVGAALPGAVDVAGAVVRGVSNPIRGHFRPQQVAAEKYTDALWRDRSPGGVHAPDDVRRVLDNHAERLTDSRQTKPNMMSMDLGGENTRNLVDVAAMQQSTGSQRLNNRLDVRQGNQWNRIEQDLADTLADGRSFYETTEALAKTRAQNAKPAFDRAYNAPWNVRSDDDLAHFLTDRAYMRRLVEKTDESIQGMTGESPAAVKPWEFLHRVKMEIDREIGRLKRGEQDSKANWTLRDLVQLKSEFKGLVDKHNPAFGKALKQYSDESALINSAEDGFSDGLKEAPEMIAKSIRGMDRQEADMYRLGVARAMVDKIRQGNVTRDRTENLFSSPDMQKRLKAIFPDQKGLREFQRRLVMEAKMADSRKAVQGNSKTAKRLVQNEEAAQPGKIASFVAAGGSALKGNLLPIADWAMRNTPKIAGLTPEVANHVIKMAMDKGAFQNRRMWEQAIRRAEKQPELRAKLVRRILIASGAEGAQMARSLTGIQDDQNPNR